MFKHAIALIVLAALAAPALAQPDIHLDWTSEYVGDGLTQYTFYIRNDDGLLGSYAATMAFEASGLINQEEIMGNGADDEPTADFLAGFGLDKEQDTFTLSPFTASGSIPGNSLLFGDTFSGYREGDNYFEFSVGTGAGSEYGDNVPLAQIVTDSGVHWLGTIARGTQLYQVESFGYLEGSHEFNLDAGGPYTIAPGETLTLDASNTWSDGTIESLLWELDRDLVQPNNYETPATGLITEVTYDYLMSLGLQPGNTYNIGLFGYSVFNSYNEEYRWDSTTLTITPEPATMAMLALGATGVLRRRRN